MSRRARLIRHERVRVTQKLSKEDGDSKKSTTEKIEEKVEVELESPEKPADPIVSEPTVSEILEEVQSDGVVTDEEEDQLRQLAKSKGISHWWSKSIERIQDELAEIKE